MRVKLIEVYTVEGARRYRFKINETNLYINVEASSIEEAINKVHQIIKKMKLSKNTLNKLKSG